MFVLSPVVFPTTAEDRDTETQAHTTTELTGVACDLKMLTYRGSPSPLNVNLQGKPVTVKC